MHHVASLYKSNMLRLWSKQSYKYSICHRGFQARRSMKNMKEKEQVFMKCIF